MTDHFSSPQWVDLVRGLLSEDERADMERHLRTGCVHCRETYQTWSGFATFAETERGFLPPADAVRVAKACLAQQHVAEGRPARRGSWRPFDSVRTRPSILATLVFDSSQAMPAGIRAGADYSRHLLFEASSMAIDLHIETASKAGWFLLAGQIADSSRPAEPPGRIDLSLIDGGTEISSFQTNEFGEFQCTFDRRQDLTLRFALDDGTIALPLSGLFSPSTASSSTDSQGAR